MQKYKLYDPQTIEMQ